MKTLSLLRHAKSSWDHPALPDFERPLNERGRRAAARMGKYIAEHDLEPDSISCSSAVRTRQTLDLVIPHFKTPPKIEYQDALYHAEPDALLKAVKSATGHHVLLIGHNPGLHMMALKFASSTQSDQGALKRLAMKYPTAALASFTLNITDWEDASAEKSVLTRFVTPKSLPGQ